MVSGIDLLSLKEVPSALTALTALFGMGRGVTQPQETPETMNSNNKTLAHHPIKSECHMPFWSLVRKSNQLLLMF